MQDGAHRGGVDGGSSQTLQARRCRVVFGRCAVVDVSQSGLAGRLDSAGRSGSLVGNHRRVNPLRGGRNSIGLAVLGRGNLVRLVECDLLGRSLGDKNWRVGFARGRDGIDMRALVERHGGGRL